MSDSQSRDVLKILMLPVDDGGCGWYRVRQYAHAFSGVPGVHAELLEKEDEDEHLAEAIDAADLVWTRPGHYLISSQIKKLNPSKPILYDMDDNMFEIQPSNFSYQTSGTRDVSVVRDGETIPVFVTGVTPGFNKYSNMERMREYHYQIESADIVSSPTHHLTEYLVGKGSDASGLVLPNGIDFDLYPDITVNDRKKGGELRILWQGGASHTGDFVEIHRGLKKVLDTNKHAKFYSVGMLFRQFFTHYTDRVKHVKWTAFQAHPLRMKMLVGDIAIIPLNNDKFNDYKSEVKFSEFAALKIPALVRNRLPYSPVCIDGLNCLTYNNEEEFTEKLNQLVKDKKLRQKLVKNAYEWVREERDMNKLASEAYTAIKKLL